MLIVITGPSGVGKTTVIKRLLKWNPNLIYSVSLTTRKQRWNEIHGVDYFFVSEEEFQRAITAGEFAEWSEVYSKYYGRLKRDLEDQMNRGDVLIGIDVQGALKLQKLYPDGIFIFLLPRSPETLEAQLKGRRTDEDSSIKLRLCVALQEMKLVDKFEYVIVNDKLNETVGKVKAIISKKT